MKDFLKHTLSSGHQKRIRDMIMDLDKAETETRAKPKAQPKSETKGAPSLVPQTGIKPIPENMERV